MGRKQQAFGIQQINIKKTNDSDSERVKAAKKLSDSGRKKNTKERAPTAKSLVQICTSASLSAE